MFNFFEKQDSEIQSDVMNELLWDPSVASSHISATSREGIVTLRGTVPHYFDKVTAEEAVQRVGGVRAVADEIEVDLMGSYRRTDEDIAEAALNALKWNYSTPLNIKVVVEKGWITLSGIADWDYQRSAAKKAVAQLMGVCGVINHITIKSKVQPADVKTRIEAALKRSAESEGRKIGVAINGDQVTLTGKVHSFSEIEDATFAAWNAPGVMKVKNELRIEQ
jgi:osmotically-inducible protein OsmY